MKKILISFIVGNFIIFSGIGIILYRTYSGKNQIPDYDFLTLIVGINTFMTTISIALAAYKVITAKNVKEVVDERLEKINEENHVAYNEIEDRLNSLQNIRIHSLTKSLDNLILFSQVIAEKIMHEQKIKDKPRPQQESALYTNEIVKEVISCLHMFVLTISGNEGQRLVGYQRLMTLNIPEIKQYFRLIILDEQSKKNQAYLLKNL